jgi:hypothetical protein
VASVTVTSPYKFGGTSRIAFCPNSSTLPEAWEKETSMKNLIAVLTAVVALSGCVAVPYHAEPAPGYYYYGPPAPNVNFRYDYHRGYRYHHHR